MVFQSCRKAVCVKTWSEFLNSVSKSNSVSWLPMNCVLLFSIVIVLCSNGVSLLWFVCLSVPELRLVSIQYH